MFYGKRKAVTFSYDDGVTQDIRLIKMLDKYGLKATFNLNSGLMGKKDVLIRDGVKVSHKKNCQTDIKSIYQMHEIASHTLTHPNLTVLSEKEIIKQVENDRVKLSEIAGYEVVGMAYPGGGVNYNDHVAEIIRMNTGIKYARTTELTNSFLKQKKMYEIKPNVYHIMDLERLFSVGEQFLEDDSNDECILYIWGHSYEFDIHNTWEVFETFCQMISRKKDIFYGTNREVFKIGSDIN